MAFKFPLTRKSDEQLAVTPRWHPNFRNFERLPDTKVVRTTFFVNTAALVVALSLVLWLGFREYHLYDLREQTAGTQKVIDGNMRQNKEAIRLTKLFADEEKKLTEAADFQQAGVTPTEFLALLGESLPKEISINAIDARLAENTRAGSTIILRGSVAGTPDQASGAASRYVDMLRAHPRLGQMFDSIVLNNLSRGVSTSYLSFDISLKTKVGGKEKK